MKRFEIVGNYPPAWGMTYSTMCRVLGERATLGAAKTLADQLMQADIEGERKYISAEVDDGRGRVLYSVTPYTVPALHKFTQYA